MIMIIMLMMMRIMDENKRRRKRGRECCNKLEFLLLHNKQTKVFIA